MRTVRDLVDSGHRRLLARTPPRGTRLSHPAAVIPRHALTLPIPGATRYGAPTTTDPAPPTTRTPPSSGRSPPDPARSPPDLPLLSGRARPPRTGPCHAPDRSLPGVGQTPPLSPAYPMAPGPAAGQAGPHDGQIPARPRSWCPWCRGARAADDAPGGALGRDLDGGPDGDLNGDLGGTLDGVSPPSPRAPLSAWTWREIAYLLSNFPLGVPAFVVIVVWLALGLALSVTVIGLPLLATGLMACRHYGKLERARARALLGLRVEEPSALRPRERGFFPWLWTCLKDPVAWRHALFAFVRLPVGRSHLHGRLRVALRGVAGAALGGALAVERGPGDGARTALPVRRTGAADRRAGVGPGDGHRYRGGRPAAYRTRSARRRAGPARRPRHGARPGEGEAAGGSGRGGGDGRRGTRRGEAGAAGAAGSGPRHPSGDPHGPWPGARPDLRWPERCTVPVTTAAGSAPSAPLRPSRASPTSRSPSCCRTSPSTVRPVRRPSRCGGSRTGC